MKTAKKISLAVKPIPEGYHAITPYMTVRQADRAIDFYRKAFGAEVILRMVGPDGRSVMHAELKIGDSRFFLSDEVPGMECRSPESLGGSPAGIYLYVRDADLVCRKAVEAGAAVKQPMSDMFWGDRCGTIVDPFGCVWSIATHKEDLSPEEIERRRDEWLKNFPH